MITALMLSIAVAIIFTTLFIDERSSSAEYRKEIKEQKKTIDRLYAERGTDGGGNDVNSGPRSTVDDQDRRKVTPELIEEMAARKESLPVRELVLHDIDEQRLSVMEGFVKRYAKKLADNLNARSRIGIMCPSVMISGAGNFPVARKRKQNAASDKNFEEFQEIQKLLDKIRSIEKGKDILLISPIKRMSSSVPFKTRFTSCEMPSVCLKLAISFSSVVFALNTFGF